MDYSDTRSWPVEHQLTPAFGIDNVYDRVLKKVKKIIRTEADLERFLRSWWCIRYNRPYKDPLLLSYSVEELLIEYFDVSYRSNPEAFKKAEEQQTAKKEDDAWAEKMAAQFGEKLMSDAEQKKHESEIEEAFEKHAEEHEVDDLLTMGNVSRKFDIPD